MTIKAIKAIKRDRYTDFYRGKIRIGYHDPRGDLYAIWCGFAEIVERGVESRDYPEEKLAAWIANKRA